MVTLISGRLSLTLAPQYGGCVQEFRYGDCHILKPADPVQGNDWDARRFSAFPMVPFCGRILNGELDVEGQTVRLPANMPPEPHAIHGFGWQSDWTVVAHSENAATLSYTHNGEIWPWPFQASQVFQLMPDGLKLSMNVRNLGTSEMPTGMGWHPYFPRAKAGLIAPVSHVWSPGNEQNPARPNPIPDALNISTQRMVADLNLDHAYSVTRPECTLSWPDLNLRMKSESVFGKLIVYVPKNETYFCVEPISHAPGTFDRTLSDEVTGVTMLAPGETLSGTIRLTIEPLD